MLPRRRAPRATAAPAAAPAAAAPSSAAAARARGGGVAAFKRRGVPNAVLAESRRRMQRLLSPGQMLAECELDAALLLAAAGVTRQVRLFTAAGVKRRRSQLAAARVARHRRRRDGRSSAAAPPRQPHASGHAAGVKRLERGERGAGARLAGALQHLELIRGRLDERAYAGTSARSQRSAGGAARRNRP